VYQLATLSMTLQCIVLSPWKLQSIGAELQRSSMQQADESISEAIFQDVRRATLHVRAHRGFVTGAVFSKCCPSLIDQA
jgi:hypothetical protein